MTIQKKVFERTTREREIVLDAIYKQQGKQFISYDICDLTKGVVSRATVYNCINKLCDAGVLLKSSKNNIWGYQLSKKYGKF